MGADEAGMGVADDPFGGDDFSGEESDEGGSDFSDGISPFGNGGISPFSAHTLADITKKARQLALASIRPRLAQFQEGITALQSLANASPQALTRQLAPQIEQARAALKQMFQQSSQRFTKFGGGQAQREQARGAEAIGGGLARLFGTMPEQARNALLALIENFQITPQPATPITQISSQPFNAASVLGSIQAGAQLGQLGGRAYNALNTPTQTGNSGVLGNQTASNPFAGEL